MLVPTVGQYFDEVVAGASAAATAAGARVILGIAPYGADSDRAQVERLLESDVDGLLLTPNWTPGEGLVGSDWLGELPVPAVLAERRAALPARRPGSTRSARTTATGCCSRCATSPGSATPRCCWPPAPTPVPPTRSARGTRRRWGNWAWRNCR
ncbi:hypothetical protein ACFQ60_16985 [Streptomyces zhihengii]